MSTHVKQRRPAGRNEDGFTILETVIALFVALVVGFGAIGLFLFSANFNAGASDRARALAIAQETMESLRAKPFTDASLAAGTTTTTVTRGSANANSADQRSFTVVQVIEDDATTSPASRQKKITVTVTPVTAGKRFTAGAVSLLLLRSSDRIGTN
jgi:Tfp pilus assembly protein PilV